MNQIKNSLTILSRRKGILGLNFCSQAKTESSQTKNQEPKVTEESQLISSKNASDELILHRSLEFCPKFLKPREVWVDNFDEVKEKKKGLIELHPKIFGTMPRLDLIFDNVKWQCLYKNVVLYSAKSRAEKSGGGRKPHRQKGLGIARQGSIRSPHIKGGGSAHGPRNPTSYFYLLPIWTRIHGLTSTLSAKFAQDDIRVVENLDIPTDDSQFILDLIKERKWGNSVLIVDEADVMPRNITIATDSLKKVTLMPVYGLNVYSMLKYETLVLTVAAVNDIEKKIIKLLHTANPLEIKKQFNSYIK